MAASYPKDLAQEVRSQLLLKKESAPELSDLITLFETLYFASLKREESRPISCRVAYLSRKQPDPKPPQRIVANRWQYFRLSKSLPFTVNNLVKLSKAVDPWVSTLAVDSDGRGNLHIWGLIDQSVHYSTHVMKEAESGPEMPGMFQAAIEGIGEVAAYKTYLLLGRLKHDVLITQQPRVFETGPINQKLTAAINRFQEHVRKLVGTDIYDKREHWDSSLEDLWISAICRLLIGIQRYGHGGAVLLSSESRGLNAHYSLSYPRLADALVRLAIQTIKSTYFLDQLGLAYSDQERLSTDLVVNEAIASGELEDCSREVTGCIRFLTSLSQVDGLVWLDDDLKLHGFGVEITQKDDPPRVYTTANSQGTQLTELDINHYGTRHRSMLRYCAENPKSIGFVISQEGDVRAVTYLQEGVVMWDNIRIHSILLPRARFRIKV